MVDAFHVYYAQNYVGIIDTILFYNLIILIKAKLVMMGYQLT